jgi:hypothetical protein
VSLRNFDLTGDQVVMHTEGTVCQTAPELTASNAFKRVVSLYLKELKSHGSPLLDCFDDSLEPIQIIAFLKALADSPLEEAAKILPKYSKYLSRRQALHDFVEGLYDFWRKFDRFLVSHSELGQEPQDVRPYRTFNLTAERLNDLIRALYRDICENITGSHPRVYRQLAAGCDVSLIAVKKDTNLTGAYKKILQDIPIIRQVLINPPLIIDPPTNTRTGQFEKVEKNPLEGLKLETEKYLCYPAQVGSLVIFVYFHERFMGLGCSLANLFELAGDEQLAKGPDAVYVFGIPPKALEHFGGFPTVFYDDPKNEILTAAVGLEDRFGYFGYLKKMILTLHNILMMKKGRMPYHGAMTHIALKNGATANVLIIGDTATGKSESLEAFRNVGKDHIRQLRIIADDMGAIEISRTGKLLGYGTEIGAFIRLDDLKKGYAFDQLDRAVIMSPQKVNARVVVPVTTLEEVLRGYPIDFLLYANNYEEVDKERPIIEKFDSAEEALKVFREGAAMAKGTTSATGLGHSYFANIFGAPQYKHLHEKLAVKVFQLAFRSGVFVGQIRTRLGIPGYEAKGPEEAAKFLFDLISRRRNV